jgi:transcription termination factor NusB
VIIDEAVELAKRFSEADAPAFVNGVLDAIKREVRPEGAPGKKQGSS